MRRSLLRKSVRAHGFTLLEVIIALAILGMALMAIFDLNAGAVSSHAYTKRLTIASLLAKSKMTDLEQTLYDDGLPSDDDEESGDFSDEGWPNFKWRAKIIAPKTDRVSPEQMIGALFNVPLGGGDEDDPLSAMASMFGGGAAGGAGGDAAGGLAALGPMAGMAQTQFTQMIQQITQSVREVHLTVSWKDGNQVDSIDLVTHIVSLGAGSDRNGNTQGQAGADQGAGGGYVNARTGAPVPTPTRDPSGKMVDPASPQDEAIPAEQYRQQGGGGGGGGRPGLFPPGVRGPGIPPGLGPRFPPRLGN